MNSTADTEKRSMRNMVFRIVRVGLIISVLLHLGIAIYLSLQDKVIGRGELTNEIAKRMEFIFYAVLTFILTFTYDIIEKRGNVDIPVVLEIAILIFIYLSVFFTQRFDLFNLFYWWDDILHGTSGVILGFIGFIIVYQLNSRYNMNIPPLLIAIFAFSFALTIGVFWEFAEFASDLLFETTTQDWNLPETAKLMGKPYQGSGLRDTMSDLIIDSIGACIASVISYYLSKREKMFWIPWRKSREKANNRGVFKNPPF